MRIQPISYGKASTANHQSAESKDLVWYVHERNIYMENILELPSSFHRDFGIDDLGVVGKFEFIDHSAARII